MTDPTFLNHAGPPWVVMTGMGVKTPRGSTSTPSGPRSVRGRARPSASSTSTRRSCRCSSPVRSSTSTPRYFGPKEVRRVDRFTQLGFATAADAIEQAGDLKQTQSRGGDPASQA